MLPIIIPDYDWYKKKSLESNLTHRCPFATVEECPRYYQSLSLMGRAGTTKIYETENKRLLKYWKKSDLWPKKDEQATSASGSDNKITCFGNYCPEVSFDNFGYFASHLSNYRDEIDQDFIYKKLTSINAPGNDWRWLWSSLTPMHYTDCPLYSVLTHRANKSVISLNFKEPWYKKPFGLVILGVTITVIGGLILALVT